MGAGVEDHVGVADMIDRDDMRRRMRSEFLRHDHVDRQHDGAAIGAGVFDDFAAVSSRSFSQSDLPTFLPCAAKKVLAMPPPMMR